MLDLIKRFAALYFTEILSFCLMGNHFHLLVKMIPDNRFTDGEIQKRFENHYGDSREFAEGQIPYWREKLSSLTQKKKKVYVSSVRGFQLRMRGKGRKNRDKESQDELRPEYNFDYASRKINQAALLCTKLGLSGRLAIILRILM